MNDNLQNVGVVVIGRNEGKRLLACLNSVLLQSTNLIYVDSGSTDQSCDYAKSLGVEIINLDASKPYSAARARNVGFKELIKKYKDLKYIQFIDGDCELSPDWLIKASGYLSAHDNVAAVTGLVREKFSDKNIYHRIANVEWLFNSKPGKINSFAGIVMISVSFFAKTNGYDDTIIAAEDDELSIRVQRLGGEIFCIDFDSAIHDIGMTSISQWWLRSKRAGHAFANLYHLYGDPPERKFYAESRRVLLWGFLVPLLSILLMGITDNYSLLLLLRYPLSVINSYIKTNINGLDRVDRLSWAISCVLSVFPQFFGFIRYYYSLYTKKPFQIIEHNTRSEFRKLETLSVGILGAGYISDFHVRALKLLEHVEISAVCDQNESAAKRLAESFHIPRYYKNLNQMLSNEKLDVVHILTPANLHYEVSKQIIEAGADILVEKPLCHNSEFCQDLITLADKANKKIGTSHNFLFYSAYQKLFETISTGTIGKLDQVEIVWSKPLGQLSAKAFNAWMFKSPVNILFEIAPHSLAHLLHLVGEPDHFAIETSDPIVLENDVKFYRHWEIIGYKQNINIRLVLSFNDYFPEHYVKVRGANAIAVADLYNNIYSCHRHTPYLLDLDSYLNVVTNSLSSAFQASSIFLNFVLAKMNLSKKQSSFAYSIYKAIESFYQARETGKFDQRISADFSKRVIVLAEVLASKVKITKKPNKKQKINTKARRVSKILVLGGTGFIGRELVRRLVQDGYGVRVLARSLALSQSLEELGAEIVLGDFTDRDAVDGALEGIEIVYHLARSSGKTWKDYLHSDVQPTQALAELCLQKKIRKLFYLSSIAIYNSGENKIIDEQTIHSNGIYRSVIYPRSKVENEKNLLEMYKQKTLPVVIFRPGIVLGKGGNPLHWGIAAWPFSTICNLYGDGNNPLPIVLVEDLVDAMVKAINVSGIEGQSFNLIGPQIITANEYLDELERVTAIKLKRVPTPAWRPFLSSVLKWLIKRIGNSPDLYFPSYADYHGRSFVSRYDYSKARKILDWNPTDEKQVILEKGVKEACQSWFL